MACFASEEFRLHSLGFTTSAALAVYMGWPSAPAAAAVHTYAHNYWPEQVTRALPVR